VSEARQLKFVEVTTQKVPVFLRDIKYRRNGVSTYIGTEDYCTGNPLYNRQFWEEYILLDDDGKAIYPIMKVVGLIKLEGFGTKKKAKEIFKKLKEIK
jgi:hypothetical protein